MLCDSVTFCLPQGDPVLTLGLIWTLMLKYHFKSGGGGGGESTEAGAKGQLLQWVNGRLQRCVSFHRFTQYRESFLQRRDIIT
jgi:hypothetical protein